MVILNEPDLPSKHNLDYAFPPFALGLPSVYERAGFDVNKSRSRSGSRSSSRSASLNGSRTASLNGSRAASLRSGSNSMLAGTPKSGSQTHFTDSPLQFDKPVLSGSNLNLSQLSLGSAKSGKSANANRDLTPASPKIEKPDVLPASINSSKKDDVQDTQIEPRNTEKEDAEDIHTFHHYKYPNHRTNTGSSTVLPAALQDPHPATAGPVNAEPANIDPEEDDSHRSSFKFEDSEDGSFEAQNDYSLQSIPSERAPVPPANSRISSRNNHTYPESAISSATFDNRRMSVNDTASIPESLPEEPILSENVPLDNESHKNRESKNLSETKNRDSEYHDTVDTIPALDPHPHTASPEHNSKVLEHSNSSAEVVGHSSPEKTLIHTNEEGGSTKIHSQVVPSSSKDIAEHDIAEQGNHNQGAPPEGFQQTGFVHRGMPANNFIPSQGMPPQGMPPQGMSPQGIPPQGMLPQRIPPQPPQGYHPQEVPLQGHYGPQGGLGFQPRMMAMPPQQMPRNMQAPYYPGQQLQPMGPVMQGYGNQPTVPTVSKSSPQQSSGMENQDVFMAARPRFPKKQGSRSPTSTQSEFPSPSGNQMRANQQYSQEHPMTPGVKVSPAPGHNPSNPMGIRGIPPKGQPPVGYPMGHQPMMGRPMGTPMYGKPPMGYPPMGQGPPMNYQGPHMNYQGPPMSHQAPHMNQGPPMMRQPPMCQPQLRTPPSTKDQAQYQNHTSPSNTALSTSSPADCTPNTSNNSTGSEYEEENPSLETDTPDAALNPLNAKNRGLLAVQDLSKRKHRASNTSSIYSAMPSFQGPSAGIASPHNIPPTPTSEVADTSATMNGDNNTHNSEPSQSSSLSFDFNQGGIPLSAPNRGSRMISEPRPISEIDPHCPVYGGDEEATPTLPQAQFPSGSPESVKTTPRTGKKQCRGCMLPISGKSIRALDGTLSGRWHRECFNCTRCSDSLAGVEKIHVLNDQPFCGRCYHIVNNSTCRRCGDGIEGSCLETRLTSDDGQPFLYHVHCLRCAECQIKLQLSYFDVGGSTYCAEHAFSSVPDVSTVHKRYTQFMMI